jgi:hypothetical protein
MTSLATHFDVKYIIFRILITNVVRETFNKRIYNVFVCNAKLVLYAIARR